MVEVVTDKLIKAFRVHIADTHEALDDAGSGGHRDSPIII